MNHEGISPADFENFFVNHHDFEQLKIYLSRFNPIRVMRMEDMEIRHSAILAWLLDPNETHGFSDQFLKAFLSEAVKGNKQAKPSSMAIYQADLRDAEIKREWLNIDIFIQSENNEWAFVIENKFHSKQGENQLENYRKKIKEYFGDAIDITGIFLTLHDEIANDTSYVQIQYLDVLNILNQLIERNQSTIDDNVLYFLKFYADTLAVKTGQSTEQNEHEELARKLYREHKKVLDFIFEFGAVTDFESAALSLFQPINKNLENLGEITIDGLEGLELLYNAHSNRAFSFIPKSWADAMGGVEANWKDKLNNDRSWWGGFPFPLICWFQLSENKTKEGGKLRLFAEVGPLTDNESRSALVEKIDLIEDKKNINFIEKAKSKEAIYSRFFKNNLLEIDNIQDMDKIKEAMCKLLSRFKGTIESVAKAIEEWRQTHPQQ